MVKKWIFRVAIASAVIIVIVVLLIPSYHGYRPRAMMSEAVAILGGAKVPLAEYFADKRKWPNRADEVMGVTSGDYTERVEITSGAGAASGALTLTATMKSTGVYSNLAGKTVEISTEDDGKTWVCRSGRVNGIENKFLPASCLP